jgi:hypothetical protein
MQEKKLGRLTFSSQGLERQPSISSDSRRTPDHQNRTDEDAVRFRAVRPRLIQ